MTHHLAYRSYRPYHLAMPKGPPTKLPWDAIYAEWSLGLLNNSQLALKYGCSEGALRKRIKQHNWKRDIAALVRKNTEQELEREYNTNGARYLPIAGTNGADRKRTLNPDGSPADQIDGIEAIWGRGATVRHGPVLTCLINEIAAIRVQVVRTHRDAAAKYRRIIDKYSDLIHDYLLGDNDHQNAAAKLLFTSEGESLSRIVKTLGDAIAMVQKLDRENFGIANAPHQPEIGADELPDPGAEEEDFDFSKLTLEELQALDKLSDALVNKGEPGPEVPPPPDPDPPPEQQQAA